MSLRLLVLILSGLVFSGASHAQDSVRTTAQDSTAGKSIRKKDSLPTNQRQVRLAGDTPRAHMDTTVAAPDSLGGKAPGQAERPLSLDAFPSEKGTMTTYGDRMAGVFRDNPSFKVAEPVVHVPVLERKRPQTDWIFYLFSVLCIYLGFIRLAFPKYFSDLFRVFFNTSLRQKQIREQLLLDRLPSLLLNVFFGFSAGIFLYFLLDYLGYVGENRKWLMLWSCIGGIFLLYGGKYLLLEIAGLIFDRRQAAEIYAFVVYMVNKMAGLFLLPAAILIAYSPPATKQTVLVFTCAGLAFLVLYRLSRGFMALRNLLKINQLQFLIFVIAFEVIPVMLIYKVLIKFF
jgi:hypothetical protein